MTNMCFRILTNPPLFFFETINPTLDFAKKNPTVSFVIFFPSSLNLENRMTTSLLCGPVFSALWSGISSFHSQIKKRVKILVLCHFSHNEDQWCIPPPTPPSPPLLLQMRSSSYSWEGNLDGCFVVRRTQQTRRRVMRTNSALFPL